MFKDKTAPARDATESKPDSEIRESAFEASTRLGEAAWTPSSGGAPRLQQRPLEQAPKNDSANFKTGDMDQAQTREAAELRKHINDPQFRLTDQQKKLLDQSVYQIENNKFADGSDRQPPLKPEQKAELLRQANRLFIETDRVEAQGLTPADRNRAVTAMLYGSANPQTEQQGHSNTCNVTTAEKVRSFTEPEKQAKQFVDMYTNANGDHTVTMSPDAQHPDGKIQYDPNSLKGDREAQMALQAGTMGADLRDQFTQGLNHLYVNDTSQRRERPEFYTQGEPSGGKSDTGERLHFGGFHGQEKPITNAHGQVITDSDGRAVCVTTPNMDIDDVSAEMKRLTGQSSTMSSKDRFGFDDSDVANINSTADLDKLWATNGGKPMIVALDTASPLFGQGQGGGHVLVIGNQRRVADGNGKSHTEYQMLNSWGKDSSGWVRADQLVQAMDPSKSLTQVSGGQSPATLTERDMPKDGPRKGAGGGPFGYNDSNLPLRLADGITPNASGLSDEQRTEWRKRYENQLKKYDQGVRDREREAYLQMMKEQMESSQDSDNQGK